MAKNVLHGVDFIQFRGSGVSYRNFSAAALNQPCTLVIKYTKTTD